MPETTLLIKAALNLRVGAVFDVYDISEIDNVIEKAAALKHQDLYKIACEIKQSKL